MMNNYFLILPEISLLLTGMLILFLDAFSKELGVGRKIFPMLAIIGSLLSALLSFLLIGNNETLFDIYKVDDLTAYFRILLSLILCFLVIGSHEYNDKKITHIGEYYFLLLTATVGGIVMVAGVELITMYVGLELLSFSLYVASSSLINDKQSGEASLKYVLIGGVGSAILLFGLSMIYGSAQSTFYNDIAINFLNGDFFNLEFLLVGLIFLIAGLGFKLSAVPFHMWAPDVYQGAPTPVTAFLSTSSKAAVIGLLFRLLGGPLLGVIEYWQPLIILLSVLTMIIGNLIAIQQKNIKRMLAYSSVGQIGYLLMAFVGLSSYTLSAALFHLSGYLATNLLIFIAIIIFYTKNKENSLINDFKGLANNQPFLALIISAGLFSLAGMPLLAGFFTKFILFQAIVQNGFLWIVVIAVTMSTISLYYYLQIIKQMYLFEDNDNNCVSKWNLTPSQYIASSLLFLLVIFIGIYGTPFYSFAEQSIMVLF
ncbi:MAG: NADH-quinone oxidoreductase subunit N [Dehalococcoidia bacterium]|jgi:NADH-quinone oxidoreductase subunit N|nr:MAG: NADH-quinone oxidoreductase subunit N [Chloroflexota bacterium]